MITALQIAMLAASIAVVVFVIFFIAVVGAARKEMIRAAQSLAEMKEDLKLVVVDTRAMLQVVTSVSNRVDQQMNDTEQILKTVRGWTERVDRVVKEASDAVESPLTAAMKKINMIREGFTSIIDAFFRRDKQE